MYNSYHSVQELLMSTREDAYGQNIAGKGNTA